MGISAALGTASLQAAVCTSTTRPTSPYEGQMIYETDTDLSYIYNGSTWVLVYLGSGFRNGLINGGFDVWQRWIATSINVNNGATGYTADRWFMSPVGAQMGAIRDTNVPSTGLSRWSLQIAPNGVGGSTCNLGQRIESANIYRLKGTVTFSAWIYNNTSSAMTPVLLLGTPAAADDFTTVTNRLTQSLQSCANAAWTKVTWTGDISAYTNINNGLQLEIQTSGHTTFGRIVRIAEVQFERNSFATPFETRPIQTETALCQRYYFRLNASGVYTTFGVGATVSTTEARGFIVHPVTMRTAVSAIDTSGVGIGQYGISEYAGTTSLDTASSGRNGTVVILTGTGFPAAATFVQMAAKNSSSAYMGFSAEL